MGHFFEDGGFTMLPLLLLGLCLTAVAGLDALRPAAFFLAATSVVAAISVVAVLR